MSTCLGPSLIAAYARNTLDPGEKVRADAHLEVCARCRDALYDLEFEELKLDEKPEVPFPATAVVEAASPAATIGPYRLLRELGQGGQGRVYLAEDTRQGRTVALKVLSPAAVPSAELLLRFQREADSLSRLVHPGICTLYETGSTEWGPYIAMRYVEGETLAGQIARDQERKSRGLWPTSERTEEMVSLMERAARALHAAHEAGLVHRDMKPGNIMIAAGGEPVILDFGLVHDAVSHVRSLTRTGDLMGTPAYMSPEQVQARGQAVDRRTDVFSLGVTLYECLTLRLPFDAPSVPGIYRKVLAEEPADPRRQNPFISRDLKVVLETALDKERPRRYQTALDLAEDLRRSRERRSIRARAAGPVRRLRRWSRRNPGVAALTASICIILLAALGISLELLSRVRKERDAREATATYLEIQRADAFFQAGETAAGLTQLVSVLRQDPSNAGAAEHLMSALTYGKFAVPVTPPLRHEGAVWTAEFSPGGGLILTASTDGTARLWDAATGGAVGEPMRHEGRVGFAAFSPDGTLVATASDDHTARVWDGQSGVHVSPALRHGDIVVRVAFSPAGDRVATASVDRTARVWDARSGEPLSPPLEHDARCSWAEFSPEGSRLLTASAGPDVKIWQLAPRPALALDVPCWDDIRAARFCPDGSAILAVCADGRAHLWNSASGVKLAERSLGKRPIVYAAFSPDGGRILTASWDHTARILDGRTLEPLPSGLFRHGSPVNFAELSPEGLRAVTASEDSTARVWDVRTGRPLTEPLPHGGWVCQARFSPDGTRVVTASTDGTARVWHVAGRGARPHTFSHRGPVAAATFSPGGERLITSSTDGTVRIWDPRRGEPLLGPLRHGDVVTSAGFGAGGKRVVTASMDHTARVWDAASGAILLTVRHDDSVHGAELSLDGSVLLTGCNDGAARLWDARSGVLLHPPLRHSGPVQLVRFGPDGSRFATAAPLTAVRVYDTRTAKLLLETRAHVSDVTSLGFSPDGAKLLTASRDNIALVHDVATGMPRLEPLRHRNWVWAAELSPDGIRIATASLDRSARVWDAGTGQPLTEPLRHGEAVLSVRFSRDSTRLVTAASSGADSSIRLWDAGSGLPLSAVLREHGFEPPASFSPDGDLVAGAAVGMARVWHIPRTPVPLPAWILDFAEEIAAGFPGTPDASGKSLPAGRLPAEEAGPHAAWARWFLAAGEARPPHPCSALGGAEDLRRRLEEGALAGIEEAVMVSPSSPRALAALARWKLDPLDGGPPRPGEARSLLEHLERVAPGDPEGAWARAQRLLLDGQRDQALAALRGADGSEPDDPEWWRARGKVLEDAGRAEEAIASYSRAVAVAEGKGRGARAPRIRALLARSGLLRQLGRVEEAGADFCAAMEIPGRDPAAPPSCVDLSAHYNFPLDGSLLGPPGGMHFGNNLGTLPSGLVRLAGVAFDARGLIQLCGGKDRGERWFPPRVAGIRMGLKCRRIHFLHSLGWSEEPGTLVARYRLHYAGGMSRELPVRMREDILWYWRHPWNTAAPRNAVAAWTGTNELSRKNNTGVCVYRSTWENPLPETEVVSLELVSTRTAAMPFVIAVTVEE